MNCNKDNLMMIHYKEAEQAVLDRTADLGSKSFTSEQLAHVREYLSDMARSKRYDPRPFHDLLMKVPGYAGMTKDYDMQIHLFEVENELNVLADIAYVSRMIGDNDVQFLRYPGETDDGRLILGFCREGKDHEPEAIVYEKEWNQPEGVITRISMADMSHLELVHGVGRLLDYPHIPVTIPYASHHGNTSIDDLYPSLRDRISSTSARSLSDTQKDTLKTFLSRFDPNIAKPVAGFCMDYTEKRMRQEGLKFPQKWADNARAEVSALADGIEREVNPFKRLRM